MPSLSAPDRLRFVQLDHETRLSEFARDVEAGLRATPRTLPCRYFYDAEGSQLFEHICELPEYYLTRAERSILAERADDIAAAAPYGAELVELGSGSSVKTRLLIEAFLRRSDRVRYLPIDISPTALEESADALLRDYPRLEMTAIASEYGHGLKWLERADGGPKLILWLGSNVGNFDKPDAAAFLMRVRRTMHADDRLLMGADLRKSREMLEAAYDDAQGVTARFNLNILRRINRELGGEFDMRRWRHKAVWNEAAGRVEMHLVSDVDQAVRIDTLDDRFHFRAGETIHTESSHKYSPAEIDGLASEAGLQVEQRWLDSEGRFSLNLLRASS